MWFLAAVVGLWMLTELLASHQVAGALPDVVVWGWWTGLLFVTCGVAISIPLAGLLGRVTGLMAFLLLVLYYATQFATYTSFVPADATQPHLWPTIFLTMNLVAPLLLAAVGCMKNAVQIDD